MYFGTSRVAVRAIDPVTGMRFPRNSFRAGGFVSWDLRGAYLITLGGGRTLEPLFEVFNITNHVNFQSDFYITRYNQRTSASPHRSFPTANDKLKLG